MTLISAAGQMTIRILIGVVLLGGMAVNAVENAGSRSRGESRPNVVFILSDDQRADTLGAWGNWHVRTPNLDRLSRAGTSFLRAHIMGGMQGAVCVPSRAMLMSGRPLFRVPENLKGVATWPGHLRGAGYETFMTGKWHNTPGSVTNSFQEGRAVFFGGMTDQNVVKVRDFVAGKEFTPERTEKRPSSELFADQAVEFIRGRKDQARPFCVYVALTSPHDPRTAPASIRAHYDPNTLPAPKNFMSEHPFDNGEMKVRDEQLLPWPRTEDAVRRETADYYAMIEHLDGQVGRILQALREAGHGEDTVVIFAGDNGLALGSHGLMGKQNVYEHSTRVPLILKGPGIPAGKKSEALCYLFDLASTIGDLTGTGTFEGNEGLSLVPVLQGKVASRREQLFTAYRLFQRGYTDGRWKLIRYPVVGRVQLFDLKKDPAEMVDLSVDPMSQTILKRMDIGLRAEQAVWSDTLFLPPL